MKLFLDSSAFAKRFVEEAGSQDVETLISRATGLYLSVICVPEVISALNRRLRDKSLSRRDYSQVKQRLALDVRDAVIVNLAPDVVRASIGILETTTVRTMDALHVACALACEAELLASADRREIAAGGRRVWRQVRSEAFPRQMH